MPVSKKAGWKSKPRWVRVRVGRRSGWGWNIKLKAAIYKTLFSLDRTKTHWDLSTFTYIFITWQHLVIIVNLLTSDALRCFKSTLSVTSYVSYVRIQRRLRTLRNCIINCILTYFKGSLDITSYHTKINGYMYFKTINLN